MLKAIDIITVQEILASAKQRHRRVSGRRIDGSPFAGIPNHAESDGSWWLSEGRDQPLVAINHEEVAEIQ